MRRIIGVSTLVVCAIGAVWIGRLDVRPADIVFSQVVEAGTPHVPVGADEVTTTWYCAGTSAGGGDYGGEIVISNTIETPVQAVITMLTPDATPVVTPLEVTPRSQSIVNVTDLVSAPFAAAVVEVNDAHVTVEQRSLHPAGSAVSPCSNHTSAEWYTADGFTAEGSGFHLVLSNPYLSPAIVDITVATEDGPRTPPALQGYVVPPQSVRAINVADAGFRDESVLAIGAVASSGRFVMSKDQHYIGGGRLGHVQTLATPSTSSAWWFADGDKGEGISESYMIYNPSDTDVQADLVLLGVEAGAVAPAALSVPAHEVVRFDTADVPGLPDGPHGVVVSGRDGARVVAERVITRPAGSSVATTVVLGAQDGVASHRWSVPTSTTISIEDVLVVLNTSSSDATVTVYSVGPGGEEKVPGLVDLPVAGNGIISIDLIDPLAFGRPLVVESTQGLLIVERRLERTTSLRGRSGSLAIPE